MSKQNIAHCIDEAEIEIWEGRGGWNVWAKVPEKMYYAEQELQKYTYRFAKNFSQILTCTYIGVSIDQSQRSQ